MKMPRDISGKEIIKALKVFGYEVVRQTGSHIMMTTYLNSEHHLAIPNHNPLKIGTLNAVISRVAEHFELSKEQVMRKLFIIDSLLRVLKNHLLLLFHLNQWNHELNKYY